MQAVTVAIGKAGTTKFLKRYVCVGLAAELNRMAVPAKAFTVPDFQSPEWGGGHNTYSSINIDLSSGSLEGFTPVFDSPRQEKAGQFGMSFSAPSFTINYPDWHEWYQAEQCVIVNKAMFCSHGPRDDHLTYKPGVASLNMTFNLALSYDDKDQKYKFTASAPTITPGQVTANIPGRSVVQNEARGCFASHVSDSTSDMVASMDFDGLIKDKCNGLLASIPASGHLTDDIVYEYAVGDSGLTFPSDTGVAVGVTGRVTYKGKEYPGEKPSNLPVPPPPGDADTHDVRIYVSAYEVNALHWAYQQAGLLTVIVHPEDIPSPQLLKVATYVDQIIALKPYRTRAMWATVAPVTAPVANFQAVWMFNKAALESLSKELPDSTYQLIAGLAGNAYVDVSALAADLKDCGVSNETEIATIVRVTKSIGMAVTQDLEFTLTIQDGSPSQPVIVFALKRHDVLQKLGFGKTNNAQTLTYAFTMADFKATYKSSTIPNFPGGDLFGTIWKFTGEPAYDKALQDMGAAGVPIPIMKGFHFLFDQAELSIQEGYLSILAEVDFLPSLW